MRTAIGLMDGMALMVIGVSSVIPQHHVLIPSIIIHFKISTHNVETITLI